VVKVENSRRVGEELKRVVGKVWWKKNERSSSRETVIVLFLQSHVCHLSCIMCHESFVLCGMCHVCHMSCVMYHVCHVSCVMCYFSIFPGISVVTKNHC